MQDDTSAPETNLNVDNNSSVNVGRDLIGGDSNIARDQVNVGRDQFNITVNQPAASPSLTDAQVNEKLDAIRAQLATNPSRQELELLLFDTDAIAAALPHNRDAKFLQREVLNALVSHLRRELFTTTGDSNLWRLKYQADALLHQHPGHVGANELERELERLLVFQPKSAVLPSRPPPRRDARSGLVEYALGLLLVAIIVIAILALAGPQVGELFSRVINGLAGT